jgi:ubiquitin carboxyl-terminal hydrolase L3
MNSLVHGLGMSESLAFQDVFSITEPALLAFVPRPAHALLLIFPVSDVYEKSRRDEDEDKPEYSSCGPDEPVIWYKQTIGNACGLIGLLHAVSNGEASTKIGTSSRPLKLASNRSAAEGSHLAKLIRDAVALGPDARAQLLYESEALESAHRAAASEGDTSAPSADDSVDLHFVCFVKSKDNHLWELDGRRKGPLDRGLLSQDEDVLSDKALDLGPKAFMAREAAGGDLRFSLISLVPSLD